MIKLSPKTYLKIIPTSALCLLYTLGIQADLRQNLNIAEDLEVKRINIRTDAQKIVENLSRETAILKSDLEDAITDLENLTVYHSLLKEQVSSQIIQIESTSKAINQVAQLEREITPFIQKIIKTLESFIKSDLPFLLEERIHRIENLKMLLVDPRTTLDRKFQKAVEAYNIERDFGKTIENYTTTIFLNGNNTRVTVLRIGRLGLFFQNTNSDVFGMWNKSENNWKILNSNIYRSNIKKGIKIAKELMAPDLIILPISTPGYSIK